MSISLRNRVAAILPAFIALAIGNIPITANAKTDSTIPIRHVIIIMQENRSFDHYFGTFPGAEGIPANACIPIDPRSPLKGCVKPFHDTLDVNAGGPHAAHDAQEDLANGITRARMDGFIRQQESAASNCPPDAPACSPNKAGVAKHDVVGYHNEEEIPNYWSYAKHFVLQDHLFEGVRSWSWPAHVELTSEWMATCTDQTKASTCTSYTQTTVDESKKQQLPWANLFQLLDKYGVSWKYYLEEGSQPDCDDGEMTCAPKNQAAHVPSIWNPPPYYKSVRDQGPAYLKKHNPSAKQFLTDLQNGTLPQVSWLVPTDEESEHPPRGIDAGMVYVTGLVNAVMRSSYWKDTVIFIAWDDWGGFYDHVVPPNVDRNDTSTPIQGYGLRVPGITISPYAKAGDDRSFDIELRCLCNLHRERLHERSPPQPRGARQPGSSPGHPGCADPGHNDRRLQGAGRQPDGRVRFHADAIAAADFVDGHSHQYHHGLRRTERGEMHDVPGHHFVEQQSAQKADLSRHA